MLMHDAAAEQAKQVRHEHQRVRVISWCVREYVLAASILMFFAFFNKISVLVKGFIRSA